MYIYEGYFNNVETDSQEIISDIEQQTISDYDSYIPKYQTCWKPQYGQSIVEAYIDRRLLKKLKYEVMNTKYCTSCRLMIDGANINKEEDVFDFIDRFDFSQMRNLDDIPVITIFHLFFDIKESEKCNINYMIKVLAELSSILIKFCKVINLPGEYVKRLYLTIPCEYVNRVVKYLNNKEYGHCLGIIDIKKLYQRIDINDDICYELAYLLNCIYNENVFLPEEVKKTLSKTNVSNKKLYNSLLKNGLTVQLINSFDVSYNKKTSVVDIKIPENKKLTFNKSSFTLIKEESKVSDIKLFVDGMLIIKDVDDYDNLDFLKRGYQHNTLIVKTLVTPRILRSLLVRYDFKTIDFSEAHFSDEIIVDMSFNLIADKDITIIPDKQNKLIIK